MNIGNIVCLFLWTCFQWTEKEKGVFGHGDSRGNMEDEHALPDMGHSFLPPQLMDREFRVPDDCTWMGNGSLDLDWTNSQIQRLRLLSAANTAGLLRDSSYWSHTKDYHCTLLMFSPTGWLLDLQEFSNLPCHSSDSNDGYVTISKGFVFARRRLF